MYKSVDSRWGRATFFAKDEYVGKSLYNYGAYGEDETEMILSLAVPGKLCLDVGANIGVISMALAAEGFEVVAFEPQPEVFKVLQMNMGGLVLPYWDARNVAVGASAGSAEMPKLHYSERGNYGGVSLNTRSMYGSYSVPVITLDSLELEDVGFIKIDVEGYELEVLKGGVELISRCRPILYVEDDRTEKSAALRSYISCRGYTIEEHKPPLYRENNWFGLKRNVWDKNYASHNLICTPC